jgi:hypothetical protein
VNVRCYCGDRNAQISLNHALAESRRMRGTSARASYHDLRRLAPHSLDRWFQAIRKYTLLPPHGFWSGCQLGSHLDAEDDHPIGPADPMSPLGKHHKIKLFHHRRR